MKQIHHQNLTNAAEYMTRKEAAEYLKVSIVTVDRLINRKDFHGKVNIGSRVLIIKSVLDNYLKAKAS
ncbi:MAG: helix-turn-helix domain-containing protein [bacterium]|nr:helix-turn-helix domain-containing protein [bacterium]